MTAKRLFLLSREDWSLHRKGELDQLRHQERVREAIRENLSDLISEESIILNRNGQKVKVPIRTLEEVRFRFNRDKQSHVGQGDGTGQPGDTIGRAAPGTGQGFGAGDQPGEVHSEGLCEPNKTTALNTADQNIQPRSRSSPFEGRNRERESHAQSRRSTIYALGKGSGGPASRAKR